MEEGEVLTCGPSSKNEGFNPDRSFKSIKTVYRASSGLDQRSFFICQVENLVHLLAFSIMRRMTSPPAAVSPPSHVHSYSSMNPRILFSPPSLSYFLYRPRCYTADDDDTAGPQESGV